ncbi:MAG: LmbU family transcriptional regulator, partial [Actinobacteria bacterium]|nr:LmbU family transcriptional regulator [Actinomycetota bacterium]
MGGLAKSGLGARSTGPLSNRELPSAGPGYGRCRLSGAAVRRTGISFDARLPYEEWREFGGRIAMRASASLWWLGDWLRFGQEAYGRRYKEGVALTGLDYQTLRNYAVVARRFELSRRRDKLSFQHHAEVCALDDVEQDRWLDRAERGGWSRNELRRRLRRALSERSQVGYAPLRLAVDGDRRERWQQAALRNGSDLESWMVST